MLPTSKSWRIALLVALAGAGFAAGAATTNWTHHRRRGEPRNRDGYAGWLAQRLELDSAQGDTVRAILRHYRPAMRAVFDQVRPQMDSLRDRMREDIRIVLTPPQRER